MTNHQALWLNEKHGELAIGPASDPMPRADEIVVRNCAVALNPVDWIIQSLGDVMMPWLRYPFVLGTDVAGEVVAVGSAVRLFQVGDRVLGHAVGSDKARNSAAEGAFQTQTVLLEHMTAPIPASMTYEDASVLPLGLSTAACGLFQDDCLGLGLPCAFPENSGKTVLIWGGSTSVGCNAIQLAVAAGYDVVTTASPRNFAYVKGLGARIAFDYASPTVVADIIRELKGRALAGALAIGETSAAACLDIVHASKGARVVAMCTPPVSFADLPAGRGRFWKFPPLMARLIGSNAKLFITAGLRGVRMRYIFSSSILGNDVSRAVYDRFLPSALAEGRYTAAPQAKVMGHGLAAIPAALEMQKKGVSARKLVVTL
jgi:NADPH:quinone reductase-like Zn-dependent oxidoreductase